MKVASRREKRRVEEASDRLLDEFDTEVIFSDSPLVPEPVFELAAEIDLIQADLAGSETWKPNAQGRVVRNNIRERIHSLSVTAEALNLATTVQIVSDGPSARTRQGRTLFPKETRS